MKDRIEKALRKFPFSNFGLDDLDELKNEEWLPALAEYIAKEITK